MRILTAAEMQAADRAAIEHGIPGLLLMEHAALAVAATARRLLGPAGKVVVVTGGGNNGGDGWAAARLLASGGVPVTVLPLVGAEALSGDAGTMALAFAKLSGAAPAAVADGVKPAIAAGPGDVVVDAIFGTGLARPPEGRFLAAIEAIDEARRRGAKVLSVDLPSGLSADTGRPLGAAVVADATVTFAALKRGLVLEPGASLAGQVEVADIGIPERLLGGKPALRLLGEAEIRGLLPKRERDSHKGTYGHVLVVAGSEGRTGAAALCAKAVLRSGAGLCTVSARAPALPQILAHVPEAMGAALPYDGPLGPADFDHLSKAVEGKAALVIGPGIPRGPETGQLLARLLAETDCPVVLDADALNALEIESSVLKGAATELVITPHPGEMARLCGIPTSLVQEDRLGVATRFAKEHSCVVVLKGAGTVIADPDGETAVNPTGNAGMATAGTGDVLAGVVGALLAQGLPAPAAARVAVWAHGLAGDLRLGERGRMGLVASDVVKGLGAVWARLGA